MEPYYILAAMVVFQTKPLSAYTILMARLVFQTRRLSASNHRYRALERELSPWLRFVSFIFSISVSFSNIAVIIAIITSYVLPFEKKSFEW